MDVLTRPNGATRDAAIETLRSFIVEGDYQPGDRLPAERELMSSLGMTRTILRKALDALEREGAIWRHVGKGTFLAHHAADSGPNNLSSIAQQLSPVRMIRARLCMEPAIAREAAINASADAIAQINLAQHRAENAKSWDEYEAHDDRFHRAVAEAADNVLLLWVFDELNRTKRAVAWDNVVRQSARPPEGYKSFAEHKSIAAAIEAHDPAAAQDAMRRHIGSVSGRLFGEL